VCGCGRCDLFTLVCQLTADGLRMQPRKEPRRKAMLSSPISSKISCAGSFVSVAIRAAQFTYIHTLRLCILLAYCT
jgi:hypothetical protein